MTVGMPVPLFMEALATKIELKSKPHWFYDTLTTAIWGRLRVTREGEVGHHQHQSSQEQFLCHAVLQNVGIRMVLYLQTANTAIA